MGQTRERMFCFAYALLLFGVFSYFVPASTWNPVSRLGLTRAIVERHVLDVDPWAEATGDRARRGEHWYTDKAPVPSILAVPVYFLDHAWDSAHGTAPRFMSLSAPDFPALHVTVNDAFARALYMCSVSTAGLAGVAVGLLVFAWLRRRWQLETALAGSLCAALATPVFPYSTSFYGHVIAASFLLGGFVLLTREEPGRGEVVASGLLLMLACGCEYIVTIPAAALVIAVLYRARRRAPHVALGLSLGAIVPALGLAAYHTACFGSPFATGYAFLPQASFARGHAQGLSGIGLPTMASLAGLLLGPRRGLLFLAPVTAIGLLGLGVRAAKGAFDERVAALVTLSLVVANAGYYMWWGGASTGPRHLVPVLPFLALGIAWSWQRPWLRVLTIAAASISFANMLAFTAVGVEAPESGNALVDYAWRGLFSRRIAHLSGASNLGLRLGLPRDLSLAPLIVWLTVGLRYLIWGPWRGGGDHSLVEGKSSITSGGVVSSPGLAVSVLPVESAVPVESGMVVESVPPVAPSTPGASLPKMRSSPPHAAKAIAAMTNDAISKTPPGGRGT